MSKRDFLALAQKIAHDNGQTSMLPVIEKELLHYEILDALEQERLLEHLTFQGGTCLRLCYGSERYSEDLDFVGGFDFDASDARDIKQAVESALSRRYNVQVEVATPTEHTDNTGITIKRWQIKVVTAPERPDIPQQRISFEVASIPAHTSTIRALEVNYAELPSTYADILLRTETLEEICADKLKAFVTAPYLRYRDLWDLRWIARQPGFNPGALKELLAYKIADYQQKQTFEGRAERIAEIPAIVNSPEFEQQMRRFLPANVLQRTLDRPVFREHLSQEVQTLYRTALD